jgi:hypothetical protein
VQFIGRFTPRHLKRVTVMVFLLAGFGSTSAAETSDKWESLLDVYLWSASIGGRTADGGLPSEGVPYVVVKNSKVLKGVYPGQLIRLPIQN